MIEEKKYTVYKHTAPNGKVYIGITGQKPKYRWNNGNGYIENKHFYSAIRKYHWENFKHDILETGLTKEQACAKEFELIAYYDSNNREKGYNGSKGGECSALGIHHSVETRRKISESNKGKHKEHHSSPETRRKISEAHKGKHLSAETRQKLSEANKGKIPCNKGKHHSAEARKKISEAGKGRHFSQETRKKISESRKGMKFSEETRKKISESKKGSIPWNKGKKGVYTKEARKKMGFKKGSIPWNKGKKLTEEHKKHLKENSGMKGKHHSEETKRKLREANKGKHTKKVLCVETSKVYESIVEASEKTKADRRKISAVCRGVRKTTGGYHWKYVEEQS